MNSRARRRSVRKLKRLAAGGASSRSVRAASGGDWSVSAIRSVGGGSEGRAAALGGPASRDHCLVAAALVEDGLLVSGELVERRVGLLRAGDGRVDLRRVDVQ